MLGTTDKIGKAERTGRRGIPTLYLGILFRSRLEARWAAFFDALKWPWVYEPLDLDGYIPDFVLRLDAGTVLVEVKPALSLDDMTQARTKLDASGWDGEALIVGASLFDAGAAHPVLGAFREPDGPEVHWGTARLFLCLSCGEPSMLHAEGSWRCRVCGAGHGNEHVGACQYAALRAWDVAGNRVQWRPK